MLEFSVETDQNWDNDIIFDKFQTSFIKKNTNINARDKIELKCIH